MALNTIIQDTETPRKIMVIEWELDRQDTELAKITAQFSNLLAKAKEDNIDAEAILQLEGIKKQLFTASKTTDYLGNYLAKNRAQISA